LPRVELMEKTRSALETPRAAIERGRSNPLLGIAAITGALLLIAWIAWAIYVTNDNGASAGLGVVLSWPVLLAGLALVASPFVGLYFLVKVLRPADEAGPPSSVGGPADPEAETEEKPAGESEDEGSDDEESEEEEAEDEGSEDEAEDEDEPEEEDAEEEKDEPEETDPDEEPPSGEKETPVSG
jgi:hypothetical protein